MRSAAVGDAAVAPPAAAAAPRRAALWGGMAAVAALAWLALARMGGDMSGAGGAGALAATFAMWTVMMVAMMMPSVGPSAAVFAGLSARREPGRHTRATAAYVVGYLASWIAFAAPAALAQWSLANAMLLDPMARSGSSLLSATILLAAGVFQLAPLKRACLSRCRSPLAFLMNRWRDGVAGAFGVGLRHGGYCVACCWALMAVMFVVGAMDIAWMALLMLLVLGEKLAPPAWHADRVIGVALLACGLVLGAGSLPVT